MSKIQMTVRVDPEVKDWIDGLAEDKKLTQSQALERVLTAGKAAIDSFGTLYPDGILPRAREALNRPAETSINLNPIFERLDRLERDRDTAHGMLRLLLDKAGLMKKIAMEWPGDD